MIALFFLIELLHLRDLVDRFAYGERVVRKIRNQLRERVGFGRRESERAAYVLYGRARLERSERDDLPNRVAAVFFAHVVDHLASPLHAEVHVDVRHRHALRIQEALEQEVELERADVGDAERVRDDGAGR